MVQQLDNRLVSEKVQQERLLNNLQEWAEAKAIRNVTSPDTMTALRLWWTHRYKRPTTSPEWGDSFFDDLLVEFLEDLYHKDEELSAKARLKHLGSEMGPTGDPFLISGSARLHVARTQTLIFVRTPERHDVTL